MEKNSEKALVERLVKINPGGLAFSVVLSDPRSVEMAGVHYHSSFEIHMVQTGALRLYAQGCEYELPENTCCLIGTNIYHYLKQVSDPVKVKRFSIRFECKLKKDADKDAESLYRILAGTKVVIFENKQNISRFLEIEKELAFPKVGSRHLLESLLTEIIITTARASSGSGSQDTAGYEGTIDDFRDRIISNYFCDNIKEDLTPQILAGEISVSERHLNRIIKRLFGKPFKEVLIETRLEAAKDLLKNTTVMVNKISEEVGYKQPSNFYRIFRERVGMTPEQFRRAK